MSNNAQGEDSYVDNSTSVPRGGSGSLFSYLKRGKRALYPKAGDLIRVLPCYNLGLSLQDTNRPLSVGPYRAGAVGSDGLAGFTPWFKPILVHTFMGTDRSSFCSPQMLLDIGARVPDVQAKITANPLLAVDPVNLLCNYAKENLSTADYDAKTGSGESSKRVYGWPALSYIYNWCKLDPRSRAPDPKAVGVAMLSKNGHEYSIVKPLGWTRAWNAQPLNNVDEFAQSLALGDITHPQFGLVGLYKKIQVGEIKPNGLEFTSAENSSVGAQACAVGPDILALRADLGASSTLNIPNSQVLVDWILGGALPGINMELAKDCYRKKGFKVGATPVNIPFTPETMQPAPANNPPAPYTPPASQSAASPPAPYTPASQQSAPPLTKALAEEEKYWVAAGDTVLDAPLTKSDILVRLEKGEQGLQISPAKLTGDPEWKTPQEYGIMVAVKAPMPPKPPAGPSKPAGPPKPPAPAASATPAAAPAPAPQAAVQAPAQTSASTVSMPAGTTMESIPMLDMDSACPDMRTKLTVEEVYELWQFEKKLQAGGVLSPEEDARSQVLFTKAM